MLGIITVLLVLVVSILITRIASVALMHTGLSRQTAKFQARSAFTGVGFTTSESEKAVNNPTRRRILLTLMILGNAGIITGVTSLITSYVGVQEAERGWLRTAILVAGITALWALTHSSRVEKWLSNIITKLLKSSGSLEVVDYASLLHLSGEYKVSEMGINEDHWIASRTVRKSGLREEGIIILGINRPDGTYLGTPTPETTIKPGDLLVLYGRVDSLKKLEFRKKGREGYQEHRKSVKEQKDIEKEQEELDSE